MLDPRPATGIEISDIFSTVLQGRGVDAAGADRQARIMADRLIERLNAIGLVLMVVGRVN